MKKKTNKKLALNKQKISELSGGNMGEVKGGRCPSKGEDCIGYHTFNLTCLNYSKCVTVCDCESIKRGECIRETCPDTW